MMMWSFVLSTAIDDLDCSLTVVHTVIKMLTINKYLPQTYVLGLVSSYALFIHMCDKPGMYVSYYHGRRSGINSFIR
jgi:hypothetical protein